MFRACAPDASRRFLGKLAEMRGDLFDTFKNSIQEFDRQDRKGGLDEGLCECFALILLLACALAPQLALAGVEKEHHGSTPLVDELYLLLPSEVLDGASYSAAFSVFLKGRSYLGSLLGQLF